MSLLVRLYKVYVRPLLESNTQVWNPWFHKDIQCIERVQRFFTRAILKRAGIPYDDRLANLGLQSLEYRRVFYDLVMCYKIYNNLVDLPFESFFTKPARSYSIRGHPCILRSKHLPHHAFRAHFFTERVIPIPTVPLLAFLHMYVCLYVCNQSINQSFPRKEDLIYLYSRSLKCPLHIASYALRIEVSFIPL